MEGHGIKILEALMLQGCVKCGLGLGWIDHVNVPCACQFGLEQRGPRESSELELELEVGQSLWFGDAPSTYHMAVD